MFVLRIPIRIWDTFAEPNIKTIPSEAYFQNQASSVIDGPRPKSRITEEGCEG